MSSILLHDITFVLRRLQYSALGSLYVINLQVFRAFSFVFEYVLGLPE